MRLRLLGRELATSDAGVHRRDSGVGFELPNLLAVVGAVDQARRRDERSPATGRPCSSMPTRSCSASRATFPAAQVSCEALGHLASRAERHQPRGQIDRARSAPHAAGNDRSHPARCDADGRRAAPPTSIRSARSSCCKQKPPGNRAARSHRGRRGRWHFFFVRALSWRRSSRGRRRRRRAPWRRGSRAPGQAFLRAALFGWMIPFCAALSNCASTRARLLGSRLGLLEERLQTRLKVEVPQGAAFRLALPFDRGLNVIWAESSAPGDG